MKKLTAGIFAGILTIVTVNAADAAIASKTYVDQKAGANTTAIANLNTTVSGHTTDITALETAVGDSTTGLVKKVNDLKGTVGNETDGLVADVAALKTSVGTDGKSVAEQITAALVPYAKTTDMTTELGGKQDKLTAGDNIAIDTTTNIIKATGLATSDQLNALDTRVTANTTAIGTLSTLATTKKGNVVEAINEVDSELAAVKTTADGALKSVPVATESALGGVKSGGNITVGTDGTVTVNQATNAANATKATQDGAGNVIANTYATKTELGAKQDTLDGENVVVAEGSTGNAVTAVAASNGVVTVTKGDMMPAVPASQTGTDGTLVLTAKVSGDTVTYAWESIERGTTTPAE